MSKYKGISLFSGAGGMDVGFENAGIEIVMANELNDYACDTYSANHKSKLLKGDLLNYFDVLKQQKGIDIVFGGPPCQGFSVAGKMNPDDQRSQLIWRFLDVVEMVQPTVFVMENVKALGVLSKWQPIRDAYFQRVSSMGYECNYIVLNASDFGVPQNRERVFFIGCKNKFDFSKLNLVLGELKKTPPTIRDVFEKLPPAGSEGNPMTCTAKITLASNPVMRKSPYAGMIFNGMGRPLNLNSVSTTLPASMGGNKTPIIDSELLANPDAHDWIIEYHSQLMEKRIEPTFDKAPANLRRLTIKEAALLQTFPLGYDFKGTKSAVYTQIGNAVPCKLAECVAKSIIDVCLGGQR